MNSSFLINDQYPSVYRIALNQQHDLESTFREMLAEIPLLDVHRAVGRHVTSVIEPTDWTGIWRTNLDLGSGNLLKCDFEVEVVDVTHNSIDALVILKKLLSIPVDELTTAEIDAIDDFMTEEKVRSVKLTDVWVISAGDEEEQHLLETAVVIEQARWFYRFLWRPWDDLVDDCGQLDLFLPKRFDKRFKLYKDMESKAVSDSLVKKINLRLKEARDLRKKFDDIKTTIASNEESTEGQENGAHEIDSDEMVDETEFLQAMRLEVRIRDIQREVEMLEDPFTRLLVSSSPSDSPMMGLDDTLDGEGSDVWETNRIHVLSKVVTLTQLQLLSEKVILGNKQDTPLVFHSTFSRALKSARSGDKIFILPGDYLCPSLPWIDYDVEITGLSSDPSAVVLTACEEVGDIFLNCMSDAIRISNLTIRTTSETQAVITVHSGVTDLVNCVVDGGKGARNTLVALSRADVAIDTCRIIHDSPSRGISKKAGGKVTVDGQVVSDDDDEIVSTSGRTHTTSRSGLRRTRSQKKRDDDADKILNIT